MASGERKASVVIVIKEGQLDRGLRQAKSKFGSFGKSVSKSFAAVGSFIARAFDPLGRGYSLLQSGADEAINFEKGIARLAIAQDKNVDQMGDFRKEVMSVSNDLGLARGDLLAGARAYQALTGDTDGATKSVRTFGRIAQATGSDVNDIATTAAALTQNLHIDPKDFEDAFSVLNTQGKAGAIELNELAGLAASMAASFARFKGGAGISGLKEMGAAAQVVRRGFGSSSEAATGFQSLMTAIIKHADKLQKGGVKGIFTVDRKGVKHFNDFATIVHNISKSALWKDPTKLAKALGRGEAEKAIRALVDNWGDFKNLVDTTDFKSIDRDLKKYVNSPAGQLEQKMTNLKNAVADAFTPERIAAFADAVGKVAGLISGMVSGFDQVIAGFASFFGAGNNLVPTEAQAKQDAKDAEAGKKVDFASGAKDTSWNGWGNEAEGTLNFLTGGEDANINMGAMGDRAMAALQQRKEDAVMDRFHKQKRSGGYGARASAAIGMFAPGGGAAASAMSGQNSGVALAATLASALSKAPIVIKIDGNVVAQSSAEARHRRRQ